MSRQVATGDRGLAAVARVRGIEEQTSRIELARALRQVKDDELALHAHQEQIRSAVPFASGSAAQFVHTRVSLHHLAEVAGEAAARLETSRLTAASAHRAWLERKTRLRAVELLLERREARRRDERARRERLELDDIASQGWLRAPGRGR